jgi:hypothetical protein
MADDSVSAGYVVGSVALFITGAVMLSIYLESERSAAARDLAIAASPRGYDPNDWFIGVAGDGGCIPLTEVDEASTPTEFAGNLSRMGAKVDLMPTDDPNIYALQTYSPKRASYALARTKSLCDDALGLLTLPALAGQY